MIDRPLVQGKNKGTIICPVGSKSAIVAAGWLNIRADGGGYARAWFQTSGANADGSPIGAGRGVDQAYSHTQRLSAQLPDGTEYIQYDIDCNGPGAITIELKAK